MKSVRDSHDASIPCPSCDYDLRGNTTGTCSECGIEYAIAAVPFSQFSPPPIRGWLSYVRLGLTLLVLASLATPFVVQLLQIFESGGLTSYMIPAFFLSSGLATLCGTLAFGSLFVFRKFHFGISTFFFGLVAFLFLVNIGSDLLIGTYFATTWMTALSYGSEAFLVVVGLAGVVVEVACERRSSTTRLGIFGALSTKLHRKSETRRASQDVD